MSATKPFEERNHSGRSYGYNHWMHFLNPSREASAAAVQTLSAGAEVTNLGRKVLSAHGHIQSEALSGYMAASLT
ncbi:hypothetical protein GCM10007874_41450 [Labrys miyagiensis]|uniref:Uncharacterized protein n=1 Tax=Labrys miyagiensis TaxID=346912 RepID=A0ABQ6CMW7_9HYPH|nr:hypothetical protein GCM10007874_41450 [Labrys miyagiensis]